VNRLIIFSYAIFLIAFVLFSYFFLDANLFYLKNFYTGFATSQRALAAVLYTISIVIFFIFYLIFLRKNFSLKVLLGITCAVLFFSYSAMLSQDIFNYLTTAKVIFKYHENPYIIMPIEFINDSNLLFTHAANKLALYGPFWIILSAIPYFLGIGNFILSLFGFKLLSILFYLGTVALIKKISNSNFSVFLFAFNPLIIIETLVGNHNDIAMIFFAMFSFFLLAKKKILFASLFLILSILIKYATIFLLPVFIFTVFKIIKKQKIDWNKVFFYSSISMIIIFLLSTLREEIYPWYAIWFLSFSFLVPQKRVLLYTSLAFSFGLLFRYIPFMLTGSHFGITPAVKTFVTFVPVILIVIYGYFKKNL